MLKIIRMSVITAETLAKTLSFDEYLKLTGEIVNALTPPIYYQDEKIMRYTKENLERMNRLKSFTNIESKLYNSLQQLPEAWTWIVLTEPWCGDASQIVPVLDLISKSSEKITLRILLRDSNLEVMDAYLTNGGRAIPKLVCVKTKTLEEIGVWGPRPAILQDIVTANKSLSLGEKMKLVHTWYDENKTLAIQEEFLDLVRTWQGKA